MSSIQLSKSSKQNKERKKEKMDKTMRGGLYIVIMLLICTLLIALLPTEAEAGIYEDTIRLHILAESDSEEDQALKLRIRDKLLEKYTPILSESNSIDESYIRISDALEDIERDVNLWLAEEGYTYVASVSLGEEWYNTRVYENFTLPSGYYKSLIVRIGSGEGRNWWCVMYPPLCLDMATSQGSIEYTNEEKQLISPSGYRVKFKILEAISYILR